MSALKEFANFILLNVANLAATFDRLLAENGGGYPALPADSRMTAARRLIKTVAEACEAETPDPLHRLFEARINTLSIESSPSNLPHPLAEIECLGQTLTPVVTTLEAGKFLWQTLAEVRAAILPRISSSRPASTPPLDGEIGIVPALTVNAQAEEQFRILSRAVEQSPSVVIITNNQGQIEYVNPKFCQITGYTLDEVIGQNPRILKSGHTSAEAYAQLWQTIGSGGEWRGELQNKKKSGESYWIFSSVSPIKNSAGVITHYLSIQEDITERKQAEDQLRKLSRAVEQSANTVVITNIDGYIEYVNPKFTETTGYIRQEAIGQHTRILKSGVTSAEEYKNLWETINTGAEWQGEFCNKKKNGDLYWEFASVSPIKDEHGVITHFLAVKEDITARKQAEERLEQLRRQNLLILQSVGEGIISVDADGIQIFVNPAAAKMLGYEVEELIGLPGHATWHYAKADGTPYPIDECPTHIALTEGIVHSPLENEVFWRRDGTSFPVEYLSTPIHEENRLVGAVVTFRDISKRKQLEQQIQQSLARLSGQIQAITEVAQQISGTLTLNDLFQQVVTLMQTQFGYYHAQIYTMVEGDMVLQAGTGEVGRRLKERGHKIPLAAEQSLVVRAVWEGEPVLVADVTQEPTWLPNPLLPETKAELAVPITLGAEVIGLLDVQSDQLGGLNEEDRLLMLGLCGQIAIAVETRRAEAERTRLLAEAERRARREQTIREITEQMRSANSLQELVKVTARELGQRLSAGHAIVELGIEAETEISLPAQKLSNNSHK